MDVFPGGQFQLRHFVRLVELVVVLVWFLACDIKKLG